MCGHAGDAHEHPNDAPTSGNSEYEEHLSSPPMAAPVRSPLQYSHTSLSDSGEMNNGTHQHHHHEQHTAQHKRFKKHQSLIDEWLQGKDAFSRVSGGLDEIIQMCLIIDPAKRSSAEHLLRHPYFLPYHLEEGQNK